MGPRALVALALLVGCGDHSATTTTPSSTAAEKGRPSRDQSLAFPAWETSWVSLESPPGTDAGQLSGNVTTISSPVGTTPGALHIQAADGTTIELAIRGSRRLAVAVGDAVLAKWRVQHIAIHTVSDVALVDREGRVVYASSGTGDARFAPGWRVEAKGVHDRGSPHVAGGARSQQRWLLLALGDASAMVKGSEGTRRLATKDGDFAVSGSALTWSPGKRPPDSSSYEQFTIVRVE